MPDLKDQHSAEALDPHHLAQVLDLGALPTGGGTLPTPPLDETTRVASNAELTRLARSTISGEQPIEAIVTASDGSLPTGARSEFPPEAFITMAGSALPAVAPPLKAERPPEVFITLPGGVLPTAPPPPRPMVPNLTRNSLTLQEEGLRPSFPGEVYTDLVVRNPSLEQTQVEQDLDAAGLDPEGRDSSPATKAPGRAGSASETVVMRAPAGTLTRWLLPGVMLLVVVGLGTGTFFALGKSLPGSSPPPAIKVPSTATPQGKSSPPRTSSQRAHVWISTSLPATVRVNGTFFGNAPVELTDLPAEEIRVEVSNPDLGFRKVVLIELTPGDNGTREISISRLPVELHIKPRALVSLDGQEVGELETIRLELYEGWHKLQAVDRRTRRTRTENFIVLPEQANRFSYDLTR